LSTGKSTPQLGERIRRSRGERAHADGPDGVAGPDLERSLRLVAQLDGRAARMAIVQRAGQAKLPIGTGERRRASVDAEPHRREPRRRPEVVVDDDDQPPRRLVSIGARRRP
jgi:hypothetical protein